MLVQRKTIHFGAQRIGRAGRGGGQFAFLHVATMDSKGNLYTGEVAPGRRIRKFSPVN